MSPIKKTLRHPKADEETRRAFQDTIACYKKQGKPVVYLDESGFAHDRPRTHGYATQGQRCWGTQDWQPKGRTNVIGALLGTVLMAVGLFFCSINSDVFYAWVTQRLLPTLPPHCVIVMDNASFHKRLDIQQAISKAGHRIEYLTPYSPALNPHFYPQFLLLRIMNNLTFSCRISYPRQSDIIPGKPSARRLRNPPN